MQDSTSTSQREERRRNARRLVTRDPKNLAAYWAARRQYLGGSDIARLVRGQIWAVWRDKTEAIEAPDNEAMAWGRRLEAFVAKEWADRHPDRRVRQIHALLGHPVETWMAASVDRLVYGAPDGPEILEIKTTGQTWDDVPDSYIAQCQWYMAVTGAPRTTLAVLVRGQRLDEYIIDWDPALAHQLIRLGRSFWWRVQTNDPPPLDASADARAWLVAQYPRAATEEFRAASAHEQQLALDYAAAHAERVRAKAREDALAAELMNTIGNAKGLAWTGGHVTWVRANVARLDRKALLVARPDLKPVIAEYTTIKLEDRGLRLSRSLTSEGGTPSGE